MWFRVNTTSTYFTAMAFLTSGTTQGPMIRCYGGNVYYWNHTISGYSDSGYDYSVDTWYKIFVDVLSSNSYSDYYLYFDNATSGIFCHGSTNAGSTTNEVRFGLEVGGYIT